MNLDGLKTYRVETQPKGAMLVTLRFHDGRVVICRYPSMESMYKDKALIDSISKKLSENNKREAMSEIGRQVLAIEMQENDAGAETIKEYLTELLLRVWEEDEGFSGKRPFGNSGWWTELYLALAQDGILDAEIDEDGYLEDYDSEEAHKLIVEAINSL